jgi:hypothetical protein
VTASRAIFSRVIRRVPCFAVSCIVLMGCGLSVGTGLQRGGDARSDPDAGIPVFPPENSWNIDISGYPVHPNSLDFIAQIGAGGGLHPDFGTVWDGAPNGIPFAVVGKDQPRVPVRFVSWPEESDPGPYPIPDDAPIEGGPDSDGDRHVLVIDRDERLLYEIGGARKTAFGWEADCGAVWDLRSNELRPEGWTSADAAGLPIFPGLVRYDEAAGGGIRHALRFTVERTQRGYIHPATHFASPYDGAEYPDYPPMGLRLRLRADFDLSSFSRIDRAILQAMKTYGMIVADNGSDWYVSGAPDPRWDDEDLARLSLVHGSDFEVVYSGEIIAP